ncbi:MAG: extracellular solute-binding protein [Clostridia bacterium]|nr:extracellular solute-binding protein [Clostridia bacterium]
MKKLYRRLYIGLVFTFLYAPIVVLIVNSFNQSKSRSKWGGFTLDWYSKLLTDETILSSLVTTLIVALVASVVATVLGTAAAIGIFNMKKRWRSVILNTSYLPIMNPEIVTGVSLLLLFVFLNIELGYVTLILSHIAFCVPYVILNVLPKLRQMDKHLVEAALDLGCNRTQAFWKVTVPEIMPGIVTGFLMSITYSVDDFVISYFTNGSSAQTLSITIFSMTRRKVSPKINALSTLIFVVVLIVLIVMNVRDVQKSKPKRSHTSSKKGTVILAVVLLAAVLVSCVAVGFMLNRSSENTLDSGTYSDSVDWDMFRDKGITLNVYNWGEYISINEGEDGDFDTVSEFERLTGINVEYRTFASNEELYAKMKTGGFNYDVIIPSDYMAARFIKEGMIQRLDFDNIPNYSYIDQKFHDPVYDSENAYTVPYTWGYVGIIYNTTMVDTEKYDVESWDILWNEDFAKNILMFNNSRDAFAIAQFKNGFSVNTADQKELEIAAADLRTQKPLVQSYVMDEIFDKMIGGEAALAPYYAGDAVTMMEDNEDLDFVIPKEGTNRFVDVMCIPATVTDKDQKAAAEMFINFMCETEVALRNIEYICYSTPHTGAYELLDEETKNDENFYPSDEKLAKAEAFNVLPDSATKTIDALWTDIMSNTGTIPWLTPVFLVACVGIAVFINVYRSRKNKRKNEM